MKVIWLGLIGLIVLALLGGGIYYYVKPKALPPPIVMQNAGSNVSNQTITLENLDFNNPPANQNPLKDNNGPYFHDVYTATSSDGLNFSNPTKILSSASVPDAVRLASGRIFIYAVDGANRSLSGLMVATSTDNGSTWKTGSLNIISSRGKMNIGVDPQVVLLDDGKLRLYYMVGLGTNDNDPNQKHDIYSAISSDGLNFTEEDGVRFSYAQMTDPDVVKIGSTWFMYISQGPKNIAATSTDGLTFTFKQIVRERGSVSKTVAVDSKTFRQFYCGTGGIASDTTTDGLTFKVDSSLRLAAPEGKMLCDPSPVKTDSGWLLIYKVANQIAPNKPK